MVVADGASGDGSCEKISRWIDQQGYQDWISVLPLGLNGGFGWAHNQVVLRVMGNAHRPTFFHFLNPDTYLERGALKELRSAFDKTPEVGCIGSQMINDEGGLQPAGFRLPSIRRELARGAHTGIFLPLLLAKGLIVPAGGSMAEIQAVSGASFMVRTDALTKVGLFDTGFFLYFEEFEWMKRFAVHGWQIAHEPQSRVHHVGGAATKLSRDRDVLARAARPFYWYQSQRRCLYRTLGPRRAQLAGLAWFLGYIFVALPRAALSRRFRARLVKNEFRDMLKAWLADDTFDRTAFIPFAGDPIDIPPAWMTREK